MTVLDPLGLLKATSFRKTPVRKPPSRGFLATGGSGSSFKSGVPLLENTGIAIHEKAVTAHKTKGIAGKRGSKKELSGA